MHLSVAVAGDSLGGYGVGETERALLLEVHAKDPKGLDDMKAAFEQGASLDLSKYSVSFVKDPVRYFRALIVDELMAHGIPSIFSSKPQEALVGKGATRNAIVATLQQYLSLIPVADELIVVDPYFLATTKDLATYGSLLDDTLTTYRGILKTLHVVSSGKNYDVKTEAAVRAVASSAGCSFTFSHSLDFHDRFWISAGRTRGILAGTSLNGLGAKYSVIANLDDSDALEVVSALATKGLLP